MKKNTFTTIIEEEDGFSLSELLIVLAIIGILIMIAVPLYQNVTTRAKTTEAKTQLNFLHTLIIWRKMYTLIVLMRLALNKKSLLPKEAKLAILLRLRRQSPDLIQQLLLPLLILMEMEYLINGVWMKTGSLSKLPQIKW